ncbi:MAG: hypothetical protein HFG33_03570 [Bacilli bacterium]|nr:hypothetical protein [Bacilli bacterium]
METHRSLMRKVFSVADQDGFVKTGSLNSVGVNKYAIGQLASQGFIEWRKRGLYRISAKSYYEKGKELTMKGESSAAAKAFNRCYQLDPERPDINFRMFYNCIMDGSYKDVLIYFQAMRKTKNGHFLGDCNFYLYLLSFLIELPKEYREEVTKMRYASSEELHVYSSDTRFIDSKGNALSRQNVFKDCNFESAYVYYCKESRRSEVANISKILLKRILAKRKVTVEEEETTPVEVTSLNSFYADIITNGFSSTAMGTLKKYLEYKMRAEFFPVLVRQFRESSMTGDTYFYRPMQNITKICDGVYKADYMECVEGLRLSIQTGNFENAEAYFKILSNKDNFEAGTIPFDEAIAGFKNLNEYLASIVQPRADAKPFMLEQIDSKKE